MRKHFAILAGLSLAAAISLPAATLAKGNDKRENPYELAERFAGGKLNNMLFSTTVDPHYFKSGNKFWYSYKTSEGTKYYVVDPATRPKAPLRP